MPANTRGRITIQDLQAADKKVHDAQNRRNDAFSERLAKQQEKFAYDRRLAEWSRAFQDRELVLSRINAQLATVDNISLLTSSIHDSIDLGGRIVSLATGPAASLVVEGVSQLNSLLRSFTGSSLLGVIPGSTTGGGGSPTDLVNTAGSAAGAASDIGQLRGLPAGGLSHVAQGAGVFQLGFDTGQALMGANPFRTPQAFVGRIPIHSNAQLRELAGAIRSDWDPGLLEQLNGLDDEKLAKGLEDLADANEEVARRQQALGENPTDEYDRATQEHQDAIEETKEAEEERAELRAAYEAQEAKKGIHVLPN